MMIKLLVAFGAMIAAMLTVAFLYSLAGAPYNPAVGGPAALFAAIFAWRSAGK